MSTTVNLDAEHSEVQENEAAKQETHIFEVSEKDFSKMYGGVDRSVSSRNSLSAPSIGTLTDKECKTQGVYNCVSVAILTDAGSGIMMHVIPSRAQDAVYTLLVELGTKATRGVKLQSVLVAGGAEEGAAIAEQIYLDFKEHTTNLQKILPPNEKSSISVGINPKSGRIDYSITQYLDGNITIR